MQIVKASTHAIKAQIEAHIKWHNVYSRFERILASILLCNCFAKVRNLQNAGQVTFFGRATPVDNAMTWSSRVLDPPSQHGQRWLKTAVEWAAGRVRILSVPDLYKQRCATCRCLGRSQVWSSALASCLSENNLQARPVDYMHIDLHGSKTYSWSFVVALLALCTRTFSRPRRLAHKLSW